MKAINPGVIEEYRRTGGRFVVAASAGGASADPDWYRNLVAAPSVIVEVGSDIRTVHAMVAKGRERDHLSSGSPLPCRVWPSTRPRRSARFPSSC